MGSFFYNNFFSRRKQKRCIAFRQKWFDFGVFPVIGLLRRYNTKRQFQFSSSLFRFVVYIKSIFAFRNILYQKFYLLVQTACNTNIIFYIEWTSKKYCFFCHRTLSRLSYSANNFGQIVTMSKWPNMLIVTTVNKNPGTFLGNNGLPTCSK